MKKAQMFVITMVFLMGFLAVIQQTLLMYSVFDMSAPARNMQYDYMKNVEDVIDYTIATSDPCGSGMNNIENNFYEIADYMRENALKEGVIINMDHSRVDCSSWGTGNPVITVSPIRITASGYISEKVYHKTSGGDIPSFKPYWWDPDFDICRNITIKNGGSADLAHFPVYIKIPFYTGMQSSFGDIRIIDTQCNNEGSPLSYEIDHIESGDHADIWVKIPDLRQGDNVFSVYYGNSAATSAENAEDVWSNGYAAVWHFEKDPSGTAPHVIDSTINDNDGTVSNMDATNLISGRIGNAYSFDGTEEYARINHDASLNPDEITIEVWAYPSTTNQNDYATIISRPYSTSGWNSPYGSYIIDRKETDDCSQIILSTQGGTEYIFDEDDSEWAYDDWYLYTVTYDGSTGRGYTNGVEEVSDSGLSGAIDYNGINADISIGVRSVYNQGEFYNGYIDDIRISDTPRSDDWINMSYQIVENQNSLVSIGSEETY